MNKAAQLNLRVDPQLKVRLKRQAKADHRTLSTVTHVAIEKGLDWLEKKRLKK